LIRVIGSEDKGFGGFSNVKISGFQVKRVIPTMQN